MQCLATVQRLIKIKRRLKTFFRTLKIEYLDELMQCRNLPELLYYLIFLPLFSCSNWKGESTCWALGHSKCKEDIKLAPIHGWAVAHCLSYNSMLAHHMLDEMPTRIVVRIVWYFLFFSLIGLTRMSRIFWWSRCNFYLSKVRHSHIVEQQQ